VFFYVVFLKLLLFVLFFLPFVVNKDFQKWRSVGRLKLVGVRQNLASIICMFCASFQNCNTYNEIIAILWDVRICNFISYETNV